MNNAAGNGGVLNREELIGAVQQLKDKPPVEHTDEEDDGDEEITTGGDEEGETVPEKCPLEKNNNSVDTTLPHKVKFGDSWEELPRHTAYSNISALYLARDAAHTDILTADLACDPANADIFRLSHARSPPHGKC